ncbi:MAG: IS1096 element passenger TnpR family protein [Rhodocyclaceae bacterium]
MQMPDPDAIDAMQNLLDHIIDEAVATILETHSFDALHARLCVLFLPLTQGIVIEAENGGETIDVSKIDDATRAVATHAALDIWNHTPIPENHFRPRKMAPPERNAPCVCGSGKKFKQCCGTVESPGLVLPPEEMAARVLKHYPPERIGEIAGLGVPLDTLGRLASLWLDEDRLDDVIALLEPRFADARKLDARAEHAADMLLTAYLDKGDEAGRARLLETLRQAPDKQLACITHQREATRAADVGDFPAAWKAFEAAMRLTPDNPTLSHLELLLLITEGREDEARARAEFWAAKLSRDPHTDYSELIEMLHMMTSPEGMRTLRAGMSEDGDEDDDDDEEDDYEDLSPEVQQRLDALPQNFAERRLVIRVELCDIDPPIWRRLAVENTLSFAELHLILQEAMGWQDCHLYEFVVGNTRLGQPDEFVPGGFDDTNLPADAVELGQVLGRRKSFDYLYDFGDGWQHRITIEERLPSTPMERPAELLDGARACPPEDCGGVPGYYRLLDALANPRHAESRDTLEWLGRWKPEAFKLPATRKRVAALFTLTTG